MRGFNINNLTSSFNKSGVAKSSHFEVELVSPIADKWASAIQTTMQARIEAVDLPGKSLFTFDHRPNNNGPINQIPYGGQAYSTLNTSIILSEDMREKEFIEYWLDRIVDTGQFSADNITETDDTGVSCERVVKDGTPGFRPRYFDDYKGTIIIRQFGSGGDVRSIHTLMEAYPIILNPIPMNWGDDGFVRVGVTFTYRYYKSLYYRADQPKYGLGFSFKIGKDGITGNVNLPGLGSISGQVTRDGVLGQVVNKFATIRNF